MGGGVCKKERVGGSSKISTSRPFFHDLLNLSGYY